MTSDRNCFAAAAKAMRRVLDNAARDKVRLKHGGEFRRIDLEQANIARDSRVEELLLLDEALDEREREDAVAAHAVKLRFFAGQEQREVATALGISLQSAERQWAFAQTWLYDRLRRMAARRAAAVWESRTIGWRISTPNRAYVLGPRAFS